MKVLYCWMIVALSQKKGERERKRERERVCVREMGSVSTSGCVMLGFGCEKGAIPTHQTISKIH